MKRNETSEIEVLEMYAKFLMIVLIIAAVAEVFVLAPNRWGWDWLPGRSHWHWATYPCAFCAWCAKWPGISKN